MNDMNTTRYRRSRHLDMFRRLIAVVNYILIDTPHVISNNHIFIYTYMLEKRNVFFLFTIFVASICFLVSYRFTDCDE
jgi:hypothetical protein